MMSAEAGTERRSVLAVPRGRVGQFARYGKLLAEIRRVVGAMQT